MNNKLDELKEIYPQKFVSEDRAFKHIRRGDRIFISTGCGQPQYLVRALIDYLESHPDAFFDTEVFHVWGLGVEPYLDRKFSDYFRYNSFFISDSARAAVNQGLADYTPIFLSQTPALFHQKLVPIDVALIQTTPPDEHGYMNLGVSVDITQAATENAGLIIAQVNANMPRVHGDGFIHYGIAYVHGKNVRERAMELIAIAHPKFRPWLIEEAKEWKLIYRDQAFIPGKEGEYPEDLETYRTTKSGLEIFLRPVKISDESLLKEFFYSLSDESLHRRFMAGLKGMPHRRLQKFVVIDYTRDIEILAVIKNEEKEEVVGIGQYGIDPAAHMADVAFAVRDDYQGQGVGTQLLVYLTYLAKKQGLLGFTADVLANNWRMLHLFGKMGFDIQQRFEAGTYELKMIFKRDVNGY